MLIRKLLDHVVDMICDITDSIEWTLFGPPVRKEKKVTVMTQEDPIVTNFNNIKWDVDKLVSRICELTDEIRAHKKVMRMSGHNPTYQETGQLREMKSEATLICTILANRRKRLHHKNLNLEEQKIWVMGHTVFQWTR